VTLVVDNSEASNLIVANDAGSDSLLGCLVIVARHRGIRLTTEQLVRDHQITSDQVSTAQIVNMAQAAGLRATTTNLRWADLLKLGPALPVILMLRNGSAMVLLRTEHEIDGRPAFILLEDPNSHPDAPLILDEARFAAACSGDVILVKRDYRVHDADQPFGFNWVTHQLLEDRRVVRDLAICAVILSFLALAPILVWRLLIDRVLYYGNFNTFAVISVVYFILLGYETAFMAVRRHLVAHVTIRADVKLSTYIYSKVLNLPIEFFERRPTGEILRDMGEANKIRMFLANHLFGTLLDGLVIAGGAIITFWKPA